MLNYKFDYEFMIVGRLSAQCRDERVNLIADKLFSKYRTLKAFAAADVKDIEKIIKPCGLFRVKARDIINGCSMIISQFGGRVPDNLNDLQKLPGIGRKTANLIMGDIYHKPAVVCDTHCIRIVNRLGICATNCPEKVEKELKCLLPGKESTDFCHRLVLFGREICTARGQKCNICEISKFCNSGNSNLSRSRPYSDRK